MTTQSHTFILLRNDAAKLTKTEGCCCEYGNWVEVVDVKCVIMQRKKRVKFQTRPILLTLCSFCTLEADRCFEEERRSTKSGKRLHTLTSPAMKFHDNSIFFLISIIENTESAQTQWRWSVCCDHQKIRKLLEPISTNSCVICGSNLTACPNSTNPVPQFGILQTSHHIKRALSWRNSLLLNKLNKQSFIKWQLNLINLLY